MTTHKKKSRFLKVVNAFGFGAIPNVYQGYLCNTPLPNLGFWTNFLQELQRGYMRFFSDPRSGKILEFVRMSL